MTLSNIVLFTYKISNLKSVLIKKIRNKQLKCRLGFSGIIEIQLQYELSFLYFKSKKNYTAAPVPDCTTPVFK